MDKNKSRTDLLSAGRKKLEQFRQKKDGKGSSTHGKSSKKSGRQQGTDTKTASSTSNMIVLSQVSEEVIGPVRDDDGSAVSNPMENSSSSDTGMESLDQLTVPVRHETGIVENVLDHNSKSLAPEFDVTEHVVASSITDGEESAKSEDIIAAGLIPVENIDVDNEFPGLSLNADFPALSSSLDTRVCMEAKEGEVSESENIEGQQSLYPPKDKPNMTLNQAGSQEADGFPSTYIDRGSELEPEEDERVSSDYDGNPETISTSKGTCKAEETNDEIGETGEPQNPFPAGVLSNRLHADLASNSASATPATGEISLSSAEESNQPIKNPEEATVYDDESDIFTGFDGRGNNRGEAVDETLAEIHERQTGPYGSSVEPLNHEEPSVSSSGEYNYNASSVSLPQLAELIRGLGKEEYGFLLKSRESNLNSESGTDDIIVSRYDPPDLVEILKEELFLERISKDVLEMQLAEQADMERQFTCERVQLVDEMAMLRSSLCKAHKQIESLADELAYCRSDFLAVSNGKEGLQKQYHSLMAEVEDSSARMHKLQISLENSQDDFSKLSMEYAGHKILMENLQVENENLNQALNTMMAEEKLKLVEEKGADSFENKKLLTELADYKSSVAALQGGNANLSETLVTVTGERNKLEEEKENLAHDNDKLSVELSEHDNLVAALQIENDDLNGKLALERVEREKLEEDKVQLVHDMERISVNLRALEELISLEHREHIQVELELKETTLCAEQVIKDNISLNSCLDVYIGKLRDIVDSQTYTQVRVDENQVKISETHGCGHEGESDNEHSHQNLSKLDGVSPSSVLEECSSNCLEGGPGPELPHCNNYSLEFENLKKHLFDAEKFFANVEKTIEELLSPSAYVHKSAGKGAAPGVSKLIKAFESKVHHDDVDDGGGEKVAIDDHLLADLITSTKEQIKSLKLMLKQLVVDSESLNALFKDEKTGTKAANAVYKELEFEFEDLKDHCHSLEASNLENEVLREVSKQYVHDVEKEYNELQNFCKALSQRNMSLTSESIKLNGKLSDYELKIGELQSHLYELQLSSDETTSLLCDQLERLQKERTESTRMLEEEHNFIVAQIAETTGRLDESTARPITISIDKHENLDIVSHVASSVTAAIQEMEDTRRKLKAAQVDYEKIFTLYEVGNEKFNSLVRENELANVVLHKVYDELRKLVIASCGNLEIADIDLQQEKPSIDHIHHMILIDLLAKFLDEKLQLESAKKKLNSELLSITKDIEELKGRCLDPSSLENVEGTVEMEAAAIALDETPISRLTSLISFLIQKCKEADNQMRVIETKEAELVEMQKKLNQLDTVNIQHENNILLLKQSLRQAEEAVVNVQSEFQKKTGEVELSEQRVSAVREKLSIAVAKGKGLVVQRDNLKQSLADASSELERRMYELELKDGRLHELEAKLKTYSEAGERAEALESELSYIRNSATALRESFLLKDSILQRIEEILEDLDLPENFHSRDIIEKVNWLAMSVNANSAPPTDWDQNNSATVSYSDAGPSAMDSWKDDGQPSSASGDDVRRKYEELQNKFYGLAEQNEMLEQSLMERNHLVHRWEELLDRINMPSHLGSVELENKIEWLGSTLSDANHERNSLQQKINDTESYCKSLIVDLEMVQKSASDLTVELGESRRKTVDLEADLQAAIHESEGLYVTLDMLAHNSEKLSADIVQFALEKEILQNEIDGLQNSLVQNFGYEEQMHTFEGELRRLQDLACHALEQAGIDVGVLGGTSLECFEELLQKLIKNCKTLASDSLVLDVEVDMLHNKEPNADCSVRIRDVPESNGLNVTYLKQELEKALSELMLVKEDRDTSIEKQQSLDFEVKALNKKLQEVQELLNLEEQKSSSAREKLGVAIRKGKSLVQHRDSLKQSIEEMNTEMEHLKSEIKDRENTLADYQQKIRDLSSCSERVDALESDRLFLRNRLSEMEHLLQVKGDNLMLIMNTLSKIDVGSEVYAADPIEKLEQIGKLCSRLHADVASSEKDSRKSKRAAELLLAELNEVQEQNDVLQEELTEVASGLTALSMERDEAQSAKLEALSRHEKLSIVHSEERHKQYSELVALKSGLTQLWKRFTETNKQLSDIFAKDLEFLHNLEDIIESTLNQSGANDAIHVPLFPESVSLSHTHSDYEENFLSGEFWSDTIMLDHFDENSIVEVRNSTGLYMQEFAKEIGALKVKVLDHSTSLNEQAISLSKAMGIFLRERTSQKELCETMKKEILQVETAKKEKDMEISALQRNFALLYEACSSSLLELGNTKVELLGAAYSGMNLKPETFTYDSFNFGKQTLLSSEEHVKVFVDRLKNFLKDFASTKDGITESSQKEMKITIANLQKELQEKDIQKERICMELVGQIKEAEAAAATHSLDLQSLKPQFHDLQRTVEELKGERNALERRVKELEDEQAALAGLQATIKSLTDTLASKDQEIDVLMQALDEEEVQMEGLTKKILDLEELLQHKNIDVENLEASHGKAMKKLSVTVSRFDELHHLSEGLLAEVERLQTQLQDRDAEISFLRQEVTKCTNDVLVASQMSEKATSDEIREFLMWCQKLVVQPGEEQVNHDNDKSSNFHEFKEVLQKKIMSTLSEMEDLRVLVQSKEALLQIEMSRVKDITQKNEVLEKCLHEKESQLNMLHGVGDSIRETDMTSEILEVEPMINKWIGKGPSTASQFRSLRKGNADQVAIAIDMDPVDNNRLEDEDDDKVHGFKSLTTSRIVPKFTRPVTDMIDGLWVSCDRALMRQPALRLGIMIYWAIMHALLAAFVV